MTFFLGIVAVLVCLVLMFHRWFWGIAFGIGSLLSCVELLTALAHAQVARALGYFFLMLVCWSAASAIAKVSSMRSGPAGAAPGKDSPDWSPD